MTISCFELYAACVGLTMILAYSNISSKVKDALHIDHIKFFGCPQCLGFWVGAVSGYLLERGLLGTLATGFAASVLSLLSASVISWLVKGE